MAPLSVCLKAVEGSAAAQAKAFGYEKGEGEGGGEGEGEVKEPDSLSAQVEKELPHDSSLNPSSSPPNDAWPSDHLLVVAEVLVSRE